MHFLDGFLIWKIDTNFLCTARIDQLFLKKSSTIQARCSLLYLITVYTEMHSFSMQYIIWCTYYGYHEKNNFCPFIWVILYISNFNSFPVMNFFKCYLTHAPPVISFCKRYGIYSFHLFSLNTANMKNRS